MRSGPQQSNSHRMNDGFELSQLVPQVFADLAHGAADARVEWQTELLILVSDALTTVSTIELFSALRREHLSPLLWRRLPLSRTDRAAPI